MNNENTIASSYQADLVLKTVTFLNGCSSVAVLAYLWMTGGNTDLMKAFWIFGFATSLYGIAYVLNSTNIALGNEGLRDFEDDDWISYRLRETTWFSVVISLGLYFYGMVSVLLFSLN